MSVATTITCDNCGLTAETPGDWTASEARRDLEQVEGWVLVDDDRDLCPTCKREAGW